MLKNAQLFKSLAAAAFFVFAAVNQDGAAQTVTAEQQTRNFFFPTLYWANPRPIAVTNWHAVFGGTVVKVKREKEKLSSFERKYVGGAIKIEKIFLNLPDGEPLSIGDEFSGENFENLKKGDRVIVFVNGFYEKEFVRIAVDGTNCALGFKVKDWKQPIVGVLEKAAACGKIKETWVEGHQKDFRAKLYDCRAERDKMITENAEVWRRYDPKGLTEMLEMQKFTKESENQNSPASQ